MDKLANIEKRLEEVEGVLSGALNVITVLAITHPDRHLVRKTMQNMHEGLQVQALHSPLTDFAAAQSLHVFETVLQALEQRTPPTAAPDVAG